MESYASKLSVMPQALCNEQASSGVAAACTQMLMQAIIIHKVLPALLFDLIHVKEVHLSRDQ
jgi:hypothetical protein